MKGISSNVCEYYFYFMYRLLVATTLVFTCHTLYGQGTIMGSVVDENNAVLAGASIILKEANLATTSDVNGNYRLKNVPSGKYTLSVTFVGFQQYSQAIEITKNSNTAVKIQMLPGDVRLSDVVVSASAHQNINTLSSVDIKLRPTNNSQDILRMVPGLFIFFQCGNFCKH